MFSSMYSPYSEWLMIATSLIAKWIGGMSISAFPLGVLGSIPSEFLFPGASQPIFHSHAGEFFGYDYSNGELCLHANWGTKSWRCIWSFLGGVSPESCEVLATLVFNV